MLMLTAASVFGLILGQLQETYAVANQRAREMEDHIDSIFTFLQENKLVAHSGTLRSACFTRVVSSRVNLITKLSEGMVL